jgi:hypothetical protein
MQQLPPPQQQQQQEVAARSARLQASQGSGHLANKPLSLQQQGLAALAVLVQAVLLEAFLHQLLVLQQQQEQQQVAVVEVLLGLYHPHLRDSAARQRLPTT